MYYILTNIVENDDTDAIIEGESIYLERIECSFQDGLPLPSEDIDTPILFKLNENTLHGTMTDHLSMDDIPGPVFSLKSKNLFDKIGITNIEYYQLTLQDGPSKGVFTFEYRNYFIANVVGLVDCVDHEKSKLEYFYPPEIRNKEDTPTTADSENNDPFADDNLNNIDFITKLVLDESKVDPSMKIFRLLDQPDLLVFHQSVVNLIRKATLSGFVFVPVSEYTDTIPDEDEEEDEDEKTEPEKKEVPKDAPKRKFSFLG